ncbi:MAG: hypothetical protein LBF38_02650 [Deltaproteobacteria bacterium]|nr:hypothetical protein [Deltaproteobacteria bacterium]
MSKNIVIILALILALGLSGEVLAQTDQAAASAKPLPDKMANVLAVAKHEDGVICDYLASETKDTPDVVSVRMDRQTFNFYNGLQTEMQYNQLSELPVGSPIKFDFSVLDAYGDPPDKNANAQPKVVIHQLHSVGKPDPTLCHDLVD